VEPTHPVPKLDIDISWLAWRFGIKPNAYKTDDRVRALLEHKAKLDRAITKARNEQGAHHDHKLAQRRQTASQTKTALLDKIVAKFGFSDDEVKESLALRYLVGGVADATIYLALLRPAKTPKAAIKVS